MKARIVLGGLVMLLAGCANEQASDINFGTMAHLGVFSSVDDEDTSQVPDVPLMKKTVASKVLSAMAFERVTGLHADPARLLETD